MAPDGSGWQRSSRLHPVDPPPQSLLPSLGRSSVRAMAETWSTLHGLFEEPRLVPQDTAEFSLTVAGRQLFVRQRFELQAQGIPSKPDAPGLAEGCTEEQSRTGSTLWDSSVAITKYLEQEVEAGALRTSGARCIELGCGTGLVGIALAAALGASRVTLTDREEQLSVTREQVALNGLGDKQGLIHCEELLWGAPLPIELSPRGGWDLVLAADCVYDTPLVEPLCTTLRRLCGPDTLAVVAFDTAVGRRTAYAQFLAGVGALFDVERVPLERRAAGFDKESISFLLLRAKRPPGCQTK